MSTLIEVGSNAHIALETLRTSHLLVQGASGSGKSYLNRVLAEQLCQHIQTIVIDPEGEYHTLREKFPFILIGEGGETPASIDTAELLARRLVEIGASAICDLYALEKDQQQVWLQKFLSALMRLPRSLWHPLVIIIDEALFGQIRQLRKKFAHLIRSRRNSTAYRLLEILVEHRGRPVHRAELAKRAGISPDTGSYGNRLSELRTALLMVDVERGYVAANRETLFL